MPRTYVPKVKKYTTKDLEEAINLIKQGRLGVREATRQFRIDKSKLSRSLNNKNKSKQGRKQALSVDQEADLTQKITMMAKWGFALSKEEIKRGVQTYVNENNLTTVFNNRKPGDDWFRTFCKRNELSQKKMEQLEKCRRTATSDPFIIYYFYDKLQETINKLGLQDKPSHIINLDETSFNLDPGRVKGVAAIGQRVHRSIEGSGKENVTTMACISANGELLPPLIIYQGQNLWSTWKGTQDIENTCYAVSDKGWMTTGVFHSWFQKFCKMVQQRPLLVIMDGHVSHLDTGTIELAIANNITLFKLPPHATDLLQPLDKCCFGPLKLKWNQKLIEWQRLNQRKLTKCEFANRICKLWNEGISQDVMKRSFEATGLYPCSKEKYPKERLNEVKLKRYNKCAQPDTVLNSMYNLNAEEAEMETVEEPNTEDKHKEGEEKITETEANQKINEINLAFTSNISIEGTPSSSTTFEEILLAKINKTNPETKTRRKINSNSAVLTSAEYLGSIKQKEIIQKGKVQTKKLQKKKVQKIDRVSSSSSESEAEGVILQDESDVHDLTLADLVESNSDDEFDTCSNEIHSGDYVLIKFATKKKLVHYVAFVETIKGSEYCVSYLRRKVNKFVFPTVPENYNVDKDDIVMKLPSPSCQGGTARMSQKLSFPIDFQKFSVNY